MRFLVLSSSSISDHRTLWVLVVGTLTALLIGVVGTLNTIILGELTLDDGSNL